MSETPITIPASLIPQMEAWGKLTARLFGQLRQSAGMKPLHVPEDQAWFWTKAWQAGERLVDEDIRQGRVESFDNVEDLLKSLNL